LEISRNFAIIGVSMEMITGRLTGLEIPVLMLALISFLILSYKSWSKKDASVFGSALSRLYLVLIMSFELNVGITYPLLVRLAIALILGGDIISGIFHIITEKNRNKAHAKTINEIKNKFYIAVDTSLTPFFTVNTSGEIEYLNQKFATLVGGTKESLIGKNVFDLLAPNCEDLLSMLTTKGAVDCKINTASGYQDATIVGRETQNGHITITGSVYIL
jgi:PAS domain-containing protein